MSQKPVTDRPRVSRWFTSLAVRTRIAWAMAVMSAFAMLVVGVLLHALGTSAMQRDERADVERELEEFRRLHAEGDDPRTRLADYLDRNVPDDDEVHVAYAAGEAFAWVVGGNRAESGDWEAFMASPAYAEALAQVLVDGGRVPFDDPEYGEAWVASLPVPGSDTPGDALVVVNFLDDERAQLMGTMRVYAITSLAALGLVGVLGWLVAGRLLAPIRVLRSTTQEISTTDLSRRIPVDGNDDLAELTTTVNGMLDRLEHGLEEQRRFLDDVGHELRTPITIVTGHLELMDADDPAEVRETRTLALEESDRMSRLVEDLVMLAKSRRPDFVVPAPTDLDRLVQGLLSRATALGDRDWQVHGDATGSALLDEQRITQAVLQLVDNAVKHTDEGDTITLGAERVGEALEFFVRDTGDGIAEVDRDRLFERFERRDVRPGDEGFGLGLSIVHAIAVAHGGSVRLASAVGEPTEFRITLPADEVRDTRPRGA